MADSDDNSTNQTDNEVENEQENETNNTNNSPAGGIGSGTDTSEMPGNNRISSANQSSTGSEASGVQGMSGGMHAATNLTFASSQAQTDSGNGGTSSSSDNSALPAQNQNQTHTRTRQHGVNATDNSTETETESESGSTSGSGDVSNDATSGAMVNTGNHGNDSDDDMTDVMKHAAGKAKHMVGHDGALPATTDTGSEVGMLPGTVVTADQSNSGTSEGAAGTAPVVDDSTPAVPVSPSAPDISLTRPRRDPSVISTVAPGPATVTAVEPVVPAAPEAIILTDTNGVSRDISTSSAADQAAIQKHIGGGGTWAQVDQVAAIYASGDPVAIANWERFAAAGNGGVAPAPIHSVGTTPKPTPVPSLPASSSTGGLDPRFIGGPAVPVDTSGTFESHAAGNPTTTASGTFESHAAGNAPGVSTSAAGTISHQTVMNTIFGSGNGSAMATPPPKNGPQ